MTLEALLDDWLIPRFGTCLESHVYTPRQGLEWGKAHVLYEQEAKKVGRKI